MQWRQMHDSDMPAVIAAADIIHVDHPEEEAVVRERRAAYPPGCMVLELDGQDGIAGYTLAHPALFEAPPALNAMLGALPPDADCLHIHDVALLPCARGIGAARLAVEKLIGHARTRGYSHLSLVAVNGTEPFWQRHGFVTHTSPALETKLASYAGSATYMVQKL